MEYTVGSVADLISGTDTPNKPKVVKKQFKKKVQNESTTEIKKKLNSKNDPKKRKSETGNLVEEYEEVKKNKKLAKKRKAENDLTDSAIDAKVTSNKKRKLDKTKVVLADSGDETTAKNFKSENYQNAEKRIKKKLKEKEKVDNAEELSRTIFVGNVPITTNKKAMKKHFSKYGTIECLRFRGIPMDDPKVSKKVAAIKKKFHPDRSTIISYIRFVNQEDAVKAEAENGSLFQDHHLRVHVCNSQEKPDESKAIFVGNLCFDAEEEDLWILFEPCGPISHVRIVRDSRTNMGKGFGYINFKDSDAVQLALEMENVKLKNRELRISPSNLNTAKKNRKRNQSNQVAKPRTPTVNKPFNGNKPFTKKGYKNKETTEGEEKQKQPRVEKSGFHGKFSDKKKKHKVNKGALEKKWKMKKIAPHTK